MAIAAGCRIVCRRTRDTVRKVTAKVAGRFARLAWEAGESCDDIHAEIQRQIPQCQQKECECERINADIILGIGLLAAVAAAIVSRGRANALAAAETRALIARLQASSRTLPVGTIEVLNGFAVHLDRDAEAFAEIERQLEDSKRIFEDASRLAGGGQITIEIIGGVNSGE